MNTQMPIIRFPVILIVIHLAIVHLARAQEETTSKSYHFNGSISVTNNGFSFIPTFSLGKPATIADLSIGGKKFSFDPQFRFDLNGMKPWSFIFIWRYKAVETDKFFLKIGAHLPAFTFRKQTVEIDGDSVEQVYTQRWFTPELTANYKLTKHISIGTYYIHGIGLEKAGQTNHTDFISLRMGFSDIKIAGDFYFRWSPQVYFLRMDDLNGFFTAHNFTLENKKYPVSLSSMMNISLGAENEIPAKDFDWNISLVYSFKNSFNKN